jgi:hypothetical protein
MTLPDMIHESYWSLLLGETLFRMVDAAGDQFTATLSDIWNGGIRAFCGVPPEGWRRTGFGTLGVFVETGSEMQAVAQRAVTDGSTGPLTEGRHLVVVDRNRCTVVLPDDVDHREVRGGYLLLVTLLGRGRHLTWTLLDDITDLAEQCAGETGTSGATSVLAKAAELQRRAILSRRETRASDYLGDPGLIAVFNRSVSVAVSDYERQALDDSLEGLDRLVNGVFAAASNRAQQRLNHVGFAVAVISVLLAATGITDLASSSPSARGWVYFVWILSVLVLLSAVLFSRARTSVADALRKRRTNRPVTRQQEVLG